MWIKKRSKSSFDLSYCIKMYSTTRLCPNVSTTPITAMVCRQCLPLNVVQLKGKYCRKPHCRNGVVYTFGQCPSEKVLSWALFMEQNLRFGLVGASWVVFSSKILVLRNIYLRLIKEEKIVW